jgi:S-DNA-T family DNA segregation ATPase FtsK/SpoIIIE
MIASLALHNPLGQLQMILVDPKGRGFSPLAGLPHLLCPIVRETEEARVRLRWLLHEMERRDRETISAPRIVVFVDELADLMLTGGKQVERILIRLAQRGRQAGIHLIACTQKPVAAVIGSLVKSNFPVRVVGSVTSPEDAKVASGLAGTGAETLCGRGDFMLVSKGETIRFQGAYVSEKELEEVVRRLRSRPRTNRDRESSKPEAVPGTAAGWFRRGLQLVTR